MGLRRSTSFILPLFVVGLVSELPAEGGARSSASPPAVWRPEVVFDLTVPGALYHPQTGNFRPSPDVIPVPRDMEGVRLDTSDEIFDTRGPLMLCLGREEHYRLLVGGMLNRPDSSPKNPRDSLDGPDASGESPIRLILPAAGVCLESEPIEVVCQTGDLQARIPYVVLRLHLDESAKQICAAHDQGALWAWGRHLAGEGQWKEDVVLGQYQASIAHVEAKLRAEGR